MGTVTGYSTKYALTRGIENVVVRGYVEEGRGLTYVYQVSALSPGTQYVLHKTFFLSQADAVANAKKQAVNKIATLRGKISFLEEVCRNPKWAV